MLRSVLCSRLCSQSLLRSSLIVRSSAFSTTSLEDVAFIGLGNMGLHMAANLVRAGHTVHAYDVSDAAPQRLKKETEGSDGTVHIAKSALAAAEAGTTVITMLPSSPHVEGVYGGSGGILEVAGAKHLLIDASTIEPAVARKVSAAAAEKGAEMLDAPVSGGVTGAAAGTLTFMVGGSESALKRASAVLDVMGGRTVHCGAPGTGQVAKVCNNLVLGISMIGVSEAMNLGRKLGMDAKVLASIFNTSSARCWSSDSYNPVPGVMDGLPAERNYEGGFGVDLMAKDLSLASAAAHDVKAPLPLGGSALQTYNLLSECGYGKKDFGSVYKFLQGLSADEEW